MNPVNLTRASDGTVIEYNLQLDSNMQFDLIGIHIFVYNRDPVIVDTVSHPILLIRSY